jgi:ribosome-associated toxin RatA of RatAB toxin-antitoxin module
MVMRTLALTRSRPIAAPLPAVWAVVSDLDGYHRHAPGLAASAVIAGSGQGARRRCTDTAGASWQETCTVFAAQDRVVIEVDVATYPAKYRALFTAVRGTWSVRPSADGGTVAELHFDLTLRRLLPGRAARRAVAARFHPEMDAILASYAEQALAGTSAAA